MNYTRNYSTTGRKDREERWLNVEQRELKGKLPIQEYSGYIFPLIQMYIVLSKQVAFPKRKKMLFKTS